MNQQMIDNLPEHLRDKAELLPDELKDKLFPNVEIDWNFINFLREKQISYALVYSPFIIQHKALNQIHYTISEFIDAIMQVQTFDEIYYEYNALTDTYIIYYVKTEEGENE